jgi:alkyl hydroperoxide reductase subunit AhpC
LIRDDRAFQELETEVLFVSPDTEERARAFLRAASEFVATGSHSLGPQVAKLSPHGVQAEQLLTPPFPVLLDSRKEVTSRYGILTTEDGIEQPLASTFVIDKRGIVRLKYVAQDHGDRPPNAHLLEILALAKKPAGKNETVQK